MKRRIRLLMIAAAAWAMCGTGRASAVLTQPKTPMTLLVAPSRFSVLQVAFDIARRFPVVLVSYQGDADTEHPILHAWNGDEWVFVSMKDFREANFLQIIPTRAVLVGDETLLPPVIPESMEWCPTRFNVPTIVTPELLNAAGKLFHFSEADWAWFAGRYKLRMQDLNQRGRTGSWYDQSREEFLREEEMMKSSAPPPARRRDELPPIRYTPADPAAPREDALLPRDEDIPPARVIFEDPIDLNNSDIGAGGVLE